MNGGTDLKNNDPRPAAGCGCADGGTLPLCAVLMASGISKRYGAENKLLAPVAGRPMVTCIADRLSEAPFLQRIAVVRDPSVAELLEGSFSIVCNDTEDLSVRRTVRLALEAADEDCLGAMFCVADQPLLTGQTILRLCDTFLSDTSKIVTLSWNGKRGNPVIFPKALFSELLSLAEGEAGRAVVKRHPELVTAVEASDESELYDIDTAEQMSLIFGPRIRTRNPE